MSLRAVVVLLGTALLLVNGHAASFLMSKTQLGFSQRPAIIGTSLPMSGGYLNLGLYHITIGIGTPPRPFRVQVDTGSSTLGVYSSDCPACVSSNAVVYSPSASQSSSIISCSSSQCSGAGSANYPKCLTVNGATNCAFTVAYGDQSKMQGYLVNDVITIGNSSIVASFGGIVNSLANGGLPGLFEPPNVEGIIGFGHTSLNCAPTCAPTVLDNFASAGILNPYMFAMCFTPTYGNLDVGQIDPFKFNGTLNYISFLTSGAGSGYYTTSMASSMFGTAALLSGSVNVIWDSGSTLIIGSPTWLNNIQAAAIAAGAYNSAAFFSGVVATMNATQLATWPALKFTFTNTSGLPFEVNIPASIYFIKLGGDPNAPYYRIGISAGASSLFILGDTFLQVLYTVFDNSNGRLAVAPVGDCSHMINSCTVNCTQASPVPTTAPTTTAAACTSNFFFTTCSSASIHNVATAVLVLLFSSVFS